MARPTARRTPRRPAWPCGYRRTQPPDTALSRPAPGPFYITGRELRLNADSSARTTFSLVAPSASVRWQPPAPGWPPPPRVMHTLPTSILSLRDRIDTRTPPPLAVVSSTP